MEERAHAGVPASLFPAEYFEGAFRDMSNAKRRAKYITEVFVPVVREMKALFEEKQYAKIQELTGKNVIVSSNLRLSTLSCWFAALTVR